VDDYSSFIGRSFVNNSATMGTGGAVSVVSSPDTPLPSTRTDPTQIEERAWIYTGNRNIFSGVAFLGNTANCSRCTDGALYLNGGETVLRVADSNKTRPTSKAAPSVSAVHPHS